MPRFLSAFRSKKHAPPAAPAAPTAAPPPRAPPTPHTPDHRAHHAYIDAAPVSPTLHPTLGALSNEQFLTSVVDNDTTTLLGSSDDIDVAERYRRSVFLLQRVKVAVTEERAVRAEEKRSLERRAKRAEERVVVVEEEKARLEREVERLERERLRLEGELGYF